MLIGTAIKGILKKTLTLRKPSQKEMTVSQILPQCGNMECSALGPNLQPDSPKIFGSSSAYSYIIL